MLKAQSPSELLEANGSSNSIPPATPRWDAALRELWLGDKLVKRFRSRASVQELVLAAFQEEGWPPQILDPLQPDKKLKQSRQSRLHDVVIALNGSQKDSRIYFYRDGNGEGIIWRLTPIAKPKASEAP